MEVNRQEFHTQEPNLVRLLAQKASKTTPGPSFHADSAKKALLDQENQISANEMQDMVKNFFDEMDNNKYTKQQFQEKLNSVLNDERSVYNQTQQDRIYMLDQKAIRAKKEKRRRERI